MEDSVWFSLLLGVGALQGGFLAIILWRLGQRGKPANKKLSILLALLSLALLGRFAYNSKVFEIVPQLFLISDITMFLYGPLFYFYIKEVLFGDRESLSKNWVHFLPAALHFLTIIVQWLIHPERYLQMVHESYPFLFGTWILAETLALVHLSIYLIICLWLTLQHQALSKRVFSFDTKSRYLLLTICVMLPGILLWWNNYLRFIFGYKKLSIWLGFDAAWMSITLLNFIIAYYLITHQKLFFNVQVHLVSAPNPLPDKSQQKILARAIPIQEKLVHIMEKEQLFLNPELNLYQLSAQIDEVPHLVSRVLNVQLNRNFFDFVNGYRIEEFIKRARKKEYAHLTFLAIALEVGFNSKTTFNKAFKKAKGLTPRQYLKQHPTENK